MGKQRFNWCLIALLCAGCDALEPDGAEQQEFESARAAWMRLGLENYAFTYQRSCECRPEWTRPARVVVEAGKVSRAWGVNHDLDVAAIDYYPTVANTFERIKAAFDSDADRIDITYDRKLFYPTSIFIDPDREVADDEYILTLTQLTRVE